MQSAAQTQSKPQMPNYYSPHFVHGADRPSNVVVVCDHATNIVPDFVNNGCLGLPEADMDRHIAFDVGAAGVALELGDLLNAPVITSNFSRLVIDPNRGEDDPTLVMRLYDGTIIPANRHVDEDEIKRRLNALHRPYHQAIWDLIATRSNPILISIHSFTPRLFGRTPRPWHVGVLHASDSRLSKPMLERLHREPDLCIGDNQPYNGALPGDCMSRHAIDPGNPYLLLELRNDLIKSEPGQKQWANRLAPILSEVISSTNLAPQSGE